VLVSLRFLVSADVSYHSCFVIHMYFNLNVENFYLSTVVSLGSLVLSFVFAFGDSTKSLFNSIVLLFVVRPYDVGDRVNFDGRNLVYRARVFKCSYRV
jgi:small-conductance mechanosensitive channel